jgi:hypothetical protein
LKKMVFLNIIPYCSAGEERGLEFREEKENEK